MDERCTCIEWDMPFEDPGCPLHGATPVPDEERVEPQLADPEPAC